MRIFGGDFQCLGQNGGSADLGGEAVGKTSRGRNSCRAGGVSLTHERSGCGWGQKKAQLPATRGGGFCAWPVRIDAQIPRGTEKVGPQRRVDQLQAQGLKIRYFEDTDTLSIGLREADIAETRPSFAQDPASGESYGGLLVGRGQKG